MAASVDLELKKHFEELQTQMAETRTKMRQMDAQIEGQRLICLRSTKTKQELAKLPPDVNTYESLGRMFVKKSMDQVTVMLDEKIKSSEEKITSLDGNQKYLEKSLKERENNLREMIVQKQMKNMACNKN